MVQKHGDEIQLVYRHFPLNSIHDKAQIAAEATEAAGAQGAFWEMHDLIFINQQMMNQQDLETYRETLVGFAEQLGLDVDRFRKDLVDGTYKEKVEQATQAAMELGLGGTPAIFINGQFWQGPRDLYIFEAILELEKLRSRQYAEAPPVKIDPEKQYVATFYTDKGEIVAQLYAKQAPIAVNSFIFLACQGWFDGVTFHRVLPGFVAQTGDPTGTGFGGPGYRFGNEIDPQLTFDGPGVLAMANAGRPNTNGSQFFFTYDALPDLNGNYTIFGRVIQGMDVLESLTPRDPQQDPSAPPGDRIQSITVEELE